MAMDREAYAAYINSSKWAARRLRFLKSNGERCACGAVEGLHVHHVTYERFGNEPDEDLRVVCERCHDLIHRYHKDNGGSLEAATDLILAAWLSGKVVQSTTPERPHERPPVSDWRAETRRPSWIKSK